MKIVIELSEEGNLTIGKEDEMSGLELLGLLEVAKNTVLNPSSMPAEDIEEETTEEVTSDM